VGERERMGGREVAGGFWCGRKQYRGENLDDQTGIFLLEDEYRGR
jgi:hypothetical protein